VGAFALREASNFFGDVRPALSRMAAHMAIARALRHGEPMSRDGELAMVVLTDLSGLQRDALDMLDTYHGVPAPGSPDRAWIRALHLRITGDWRQHHAGEDETLLERFEYARAIRERLGIDAFLDYVDTIPRRDEALADWHRLALRDSEVSVESGGRFAATSVDSELREAERVWSVLHGSTIDPETLVPALNDRPSQSPVVTIGSQQRVDVLDWGTWAAFEQRTLIESLALNLSHVRMLGIEGSIGETLERMDASFGRLTLYPVVERWIAEDREQYEDALARARPIADAHPELLTAAEWNYLLQRPGFVQRAVPFPVNVGWFDPAEPEGTAFDLPNRSLQPGCPRPPTLEQAAWLAHEQPYDEWTVWANAWYQYPGKGRKPSADAIRKAFGALVEYDDIALRNFVGYIDLSEAERFELMQHRCDLDAGNCVAVAKWLLLDNRERDAASMYERFIAQSRDEVAISQNINWLVRYYRAHGKLTEAGSLASRGAQTQSRAGLEALADLLAAEGQYGDAEKVYRNIAEHYNITAPLGTFLLRRALEANDKALQIKAFELLRRDFPNGVERVQPYALPATPSDGAQFETFGRRVAGFGFQPDDVIISIDGWRVHNAAQEWDAWRMSTSENVDFVVWRDGRYREIHVRVPQRWLAATFRDY
jgi:hypothetical protein